MHPTGVGKTRDWIHHFLQDHQEMEEEVPGPYGPDRMNLFVYYRDLPMVQVRGDTNLTDVWILDE